MHLRFLVGVITALTVAGTALGGGSPHAVRGYGLSVIPPPGWVGHVLPGEITAIAPQGAVVQLDEAAVSPQRYVRLPKHVRAGTTRMFVRAGGRAFFLYVHSTAARLAETNRALASVRVTPWSAPLAPPRFASSPGWQVGHSGPTPNSAQAQASAWASTVAYENSPVDLPPDATLAYAGSGGIVVWVGLSRPRRTNPFPTRLDPLDLRQALCTHSWEGAIPGVIQCTLGSQVPGRYQISIYVYLRERSRLGAAQAELRRLALPAWPRTSAPPAPGRANCKPPSPLGVFGTRTLPEAKGTATRGSVWALFFPGLGMHWQPGHAIFTSYVGKDFKIVLRVTGSGPVHVTARRIGRKVLKPNWGPQAHGGSTWNRPGEEWGIGFTFPTPGCYDLHATRRGASGDVWVLIR